MAQKQFSLHLDREPTFETTVTEQNINTDIEIRGFFKGMQHSIDICSKSRRGKIASLAIRKELTTLSLKNDQRLFPVESKMSLITKIEYAICLFAFGLGLVFLLLNSAAIEQKRNHDNLCQNYKNEINNHALLNGQKPPCL